MVAKQNAGLRTEREQTEREVQKFISSGEEPEARVQNLGTAP